MNRPKVSVFLALSLDGHVAGVGGDLSWLDPYASDSAEDTGYARLMSEVDTMVIGRKTYDQVLDFTPWPFDGKQTVVLTHRPISPRHGESSYAGPLEALLVRLHARGARHVYLDGGDAVRQGLTAALVDELTLSWVPVMLGHGIRLFDASLPPSAWTLQTARRLPSGLVQTIYRCAPADGANHPEAPSQ